MRWIKIHYYFNRDDLVHIKEGEEQKKKLYRALCILKEPVTREIINKLNIPDGFLVQQKTPLRVLHRRPLLTRPRQIYSVKAYVSKGITIVHSIPEKMIINILPFHRKLKEHHCYWHFNSGWRVCEGIDTRRIRQDFAQYFFNYWSIYRYYCLRRQRNRLRLACWSWHGLSYFDDYYVCIYCHMVFLWQPKKPTNE